MFSLFSSDISVEFLNGVENRGKWSTSGQLIGDFHEHTGVGELVHGFKSLFFDAH